MGTGKGQAKRLKAISPVTGIGSRSKKSGRTAIKNGKQFEKLGKRAIRKGGYSTPIIELQKGMSQQAKKKEENKRIMEKFFNKENVSKTSSPTFCKQPRKGTTYSSKIGRGDYGLIVDNHPLLLEFKFQNTTGSAIDKIGAVCLEAEKHGIDTILVVGGKYPNWEHTMNEVKKDIESGFLKHVKGIIRIEDFEDQMESGQFLEMHKQLAKESKNRQNY